MQRAPGDGRGSTGYTTKESLIAALLKANLGELAKKGMSCYILMLKIRNRFGIVNAMNLAVVMSTCRVRELKCVEHAGMTEFIV